LVESVIGGHRRNVGLQMGAGITLTYRYSEEGVSVTDEEYEAG
jgi:hypothetical protein